jgi:hypothetical protein
MVAHDHPNHSFGSSQIRIFFVLFRSESRKPTLALGFNRDESYVSLRFQMSISAIVLQGPIEQLMA